MPIRESVVSGHADVPNVIVSLYPQDHAAIPYHTMHHTFIAHIHTQTALHPTRASLNKQSTRTAVWAATGIL
jgi:hypothetical protein